ncbi:hypothetical protein [Lyngbya aestuarii]|uniref:hypothetical protein n=1 Tax=Lyngbya aestuarii TaxID=118322 RepID=UPI00403D7413
MKTSSFSISACRLCRYYQPEGRRGGLCQQLGVPVKACWKPCALALEPFATSWKGLDVIWQKDELISSAELNVNCSTRESEQNLPHGNGVVQRESLTAEMAIV